MIPNEHDESGQDRVARNEASESGFTGRYSRRDLLDRASKTLIQTFGAGAFAYVAGIEVLGRAKSLGASDLRALGAASGDPASAQALERSLSRYRERTEGESAVAACSCTCSCSCTANCQCQCGGDPCSCSCGCGCSCNCGCECSCRCKCTTCSCTIETSAGNQASTRESTWQTNYSPNMHSSLDKGSESVVASDWGGDGDTISAKGQNNNATLAESATQSAAALSTATSGGNATSASTETSSDDGTYHSTFQSSSPRDRARAHRSAVLDVDWARLSGILR